MEQQGCRFCPTARENEYPSCPPLGETQHSEIRLIETLKPAIIGGEGRIAFHRKVEGGPLFAHEASPFASTRWTNLYIPLKPWFGGDPVGGKLIDSIGPGVRDRLEGMATTPGARNLAMKVQMMQGPELTWMRRLRRP